MKTIFFVIGLVFTVSGKNSATASNEFTGPINEMKNDVSSVLQQLNDIKKTELPTLRLKVSISLQRNALIIESKESLDASKAEGNLVEECEELFHNSYYSAIEQLEKYVANNITRDLAGVENSLVSLNSKLDALKQKTEQADSATDDIISDVLDEMDECLNTIDKTKNILPTFIHHIVKNLENDVNVEKLVRETIVDPVDVCLEDAKITEMNF